ncbi:TetR/AcrR family transcriptional regulator [Streptomyces canus]|uniref:TetR/AcrR family transcriptional regulator n=1 Tax=Streptomyces canus TaxID=58343 RepID=UPI00369FDFEA
MGRDINAKSVRSNEALLRAALHRFAHYGYGPTTLKDIAADVGVSPGAINHQFGSKRDLYGATGDMAIGHLADEYENFEKSSAGQANQRRRVEAFFQLMADTATDYLDHHWSGIGVELDAALDESISEIRDRWGRQLERIYRTTLYQGTRPEPADEDGWDRDPATVLVSVFVLGQSWMVVRKGPESIEPAVRMLKRLIERSAPDDASEESPRSGL